MQILPRYVFLACQTSPRTHASEHTRRSLEVHVWNEYFQQLAGQKSSRTPHAFQDTFFAAVTPWNSLHPPPPHTHTRMHTGHVCTARPCSFLTETDAAGACLSGRPLARAFLVGHNRFFHFDDFQPRSTVGFLAPNSKVEVSILSFD